MSIDCENDEVSNEVSLYSMKFKSYNLRSFKTINVYIYIYIYIYVYIYKYCVRVPQFYLQNVFVISPILLVLHFVLAYCSLVTFSFSIFSAYLHSVLMTLWSILIESFFGTLLTFVGVTPTSWFCHSIRDCLLILYVYVYVYVCVCIFTFMCMYMYMYLYVYIL